MNYYYVTDISGTKELTHKDTSWIEIHRQGKWHHPEYGKMEGSNKLFNSFISNWKNNVIGRRLIFDKNHKPDDGGTAFVQDIKIEDDRLKALVKFTPFGLDLVRNKGFIYFSPEYTDNYVDKENKRSHGPTLLGGALTLRPFLTNLRPIVMSKNLEDRIYHNYLSNDIIEDDVLKILEELAEEHKISITDLTSKLIFSLGN